MESESQLWRRLSAGLLVVTFVALAGGYLGWLHPLGDSLAVGRVLAIIGVLVAAVLANIAGLQTASFVSTLVAMICGLQVGLAYFVPGPPGSIAVYQKNLNYRTAALAEVEADIRATAPLVITLQEVSEPNLALVDSLKDSYPYQQVCPGDGVGGPAVLSRLRMVEGTGFCAPGMAAMLVATEDGRTFWLVSIHLHWPWPYQQADHVKVLLPVLAKLDGPVIMAGDFNMVRWGHSVRSMAEVTETKPAGPALGTYLGFDPFLTLAIDHVFAPYGGRVYLREAYGSDHYGLLVKVEL
ncbi:MAG TPA: endonuclease/exonuclease/phosphatase family protein [Tabrizicola sp.]|nr:endonuclease/exonuclease/phosphatase family protein [Tabrizicola sp.]